MKIKNYEIKKKLLVSFGIPLGLFLVTIVVFIAGVFYFVMNWIVSIAFQRLEKKLSYYR